MDSKCEVCGEYGREVVLGNSLSARLCGQCRRKYDLWAEGRDDLAWFKELLERQKDCRCLVMGGCKEINPLDGSHTPPSSAEEQPAHLREQLVWESAVVRKAILAWLHDEAMKETGRKEQRANDDS